MPEKPHELTLFLDQPLYVALTQFQALNKLGKSYAGLLIFIEGLRKLGLIGEVVYQYYYQRYFKPLQTTPIEEDPRVVKKKEEELQETRRQLRQVIERFPTLKPKTQQHWLRYCLDRPEIPDSTELLRKHGKGVK
jgi:hypothetical protein